MRWRSPWRAGVAARGGAPPGGGGPARGMPGLARWSMGVTARALNQDHSPCGLRGFAWSESRLGACESRRDATMPSSPGRSVFSSSSAELAPKTPATSVDRLDGYSFAPIVAIMDACESARAYRPEGWQGSSLSAAALLDPKAVCGGECRGYGGFASWDVAGRSWINFDSVTAKFARIAAILCSPIH